MNRKTPDLDLALVRRALAAPLPGEAAQMRMAPRPRPGRLDAPPEGPPRQGAVLIALYPWQDALYLPLTRRSQRLADHRGQVSFPGGRREPDDATFWHTALREAKEEVAIEPASVQHLGALTELYIPASHYCVHPYVGYVPLRPTFALDPREVEALIELPLATILDPVIKRVETWPWGERTREVPFYAYADQVIWGATAMMLSELETLLRAALDAN